MRFLASLLIFGFLLCAGPSSAQLSSAGAGCSVNCGSGVQLTQIIAANGAAGIASGSPTVVTTTNDAPVGSLIVFAVNLNANLAQTVATCADNATGGSNTYQIVQHAATTGVNNAALCWSVTTNDLPVGSKFTVTTTGSVTYSFRGAWVVPGYTGGVDVSAAVNQATPGTSVAGLATGTMTNASDLVFGYVNAITTGPYVFTESAGFTNLFNDSFNDIGYAQPGVTTSLAFAPSWTGGSSVYSAVVAAFFPTGSCSQAPVFLARTSGLSGTETTAYTNLICGMVADGTWSLMDGLYISATHNLATFELNLISTSFGLSQVGSCAFTADSNIQCDGSTGYFLPGWTPSTAGGHFAQNSASIGVCDLTSKTSSSTTNYAIGGTDNVSNVHGIGLDITDGNSSNQVRYELNNSKLAGIAPNTNSLGSWIVSRTASNLVTLYINGSSTDTDSTASGGLNTTPIAILANRTSTGTFNDFFPDKVAYIFFGGGMTATQVSNVYSRLHTFLTAVGAPSGC